MIANFVARSSLNGQSILLKWEWVSATQPTNIFRLVRSIGRYEDSQLRGQNILLSSLNPERGIDPATGENRWNYKFEDKELTPGVHYYYTLSTAADSVHACALATEQYGLAKHLYRLLPGILKLYDHPTGGQATEGSLKGFLEIFGLTLDLARGYAESLRDNHDIFTARADLLPHLADLIGWNLDLTLDLAGQRQELSFAPEVYRALGTLPNLRAMVNRATGWDCQLKEFTRNIFLSNAPESIRLWEIWNSTLTKAVSPETGYKVIREKPLHTELGEWFEGRPAAVKINDTVWVFWTSNRIERRQIYLQRFIWKDTGLDPYDPSPLPVTPFQPTFGSPAWVIDEDPAVAWDDANQKLWLFWSSNRSGSWDVWARTFDADQPQEAITEPQFEFYRVTYHQAEDRRPAAIVFQKKVWLFWQSNYGGAMNIWCQQLDKNIWSSPQPVTKTADRNESPSVATDGKNLWLAWQSGSETRTNINCLRLLKYPEWENISLSISNKTCEAPALLYHDKKLFLLFHATVGGKCNICMYRIPPPIKSTQTSSTRLSIIRPLIPITSHLELDKEPTVIALDDDYLQLFWRSQERGKYFRSRSVDLSDKEELSLLKTHADRVHYTYDPGAGNSNWYSFNTVGIYLKPDDTAETLVLRELDQTYIESIIKEFLPIQVRAVLIVLLTKIETVYNSERSIGESFTTQINTQHDEIYPGVNSRFYDETSDWDWLRAWYAGLNIAEIDSKIGSTNNMKWRTIHNNFKIPKLGG